MKLPGTKTLRRTQRWAISRMRRHGIILGYHRIADTQSDPYKLCVSPKNFAEHLEIIHRHAKPSSLANMVQQIKDSTLPSKTIAITFDDGYSETLFTAKPLLEKQDTPATCFVVSGFLGRSLWWDQLHYGFDTEISGKMAATSTASESEQAEIEANVEHMYKSLLHLDDRQREKELATLRTNFESIRSEIQPPRVLNEYELVELAEDDLIEIGAHSHGHPLLATLSTEDQKIDIYRSRDVLSDIIGLPIRAFSYPNGSVSQQTRKLVDEAGFAYACASHNDVVSADSDPLRLPRFWVPNWNGDTFERWLKRWL